MGIVRSRLFSRALRVSLAFLGIIVALAALRALGSGTVAHAATATYYPSFCLGGWENPRRASGNLETGNGQDASRFTKSNSAYLDSDVSAQIFCGYFPVEERKNPPVSAAIRIVWNMDTASIATPSDVLPASPADAPSDADSNTRTPDPAPAIPASETPTADPAPAEPATDTPSMEAPATPQSTPAPESAPTSSASSPLQVIASWIIAHTPQAYAQETPTISTSLSDWFDVSYSLDGVRWTSIGRVNAQNWKDFTVRVPLASWDDLKDVQIMIAALPSLSTRPPVFLDGLELRVENDPTLAENAAAAASLAGGVLDSALDVVSGIGDSIASLITGDATDTPVDQPSAQPEAAPDITVAPAPTPETPAPKRMRRMLQFSVRGSAVPASTRLPWQEKEVQDRLASTTQSAVPSITRSDDGRSYIVSGSCSDKYAVIITYRNEGDYRDNPRSSLINSSTPCDAGHYAFNLGGLPDSTQGGTFYLLVGAQGETGTWTPASALIPITIEPTEVQE